MKRILTLSILAAAVLATGCTRIETGEVGLRVGFDKQVKNEELLPGSFNQTIIGSVMTFPVKEVAVKAKPIAKKPIKEVKTISKIVKPVFVEEPIIEIKYSWDIENIEINNLTNVITQITYELIGTLNDQSYPVSGTILIPKEGVLSNKVETGDYKTLTKQEIIDYMVSRISEKHAESMKALITQNLNGTKIIDKTFWKS